jgi:hypothetical protein
MLSIIKYLINFFHQDKQVNYDNISYKSLIEPYKLFVTECFVDGEYFQSKSNNEYYNIIPKNMSVEDMCYIDEFFHKNIFIEMLKNYNFSNDKHIIIKLIFDKNKLYFVERNQNISIRYPNFTIIQNIESVDNFINNLGPFIPIPE